MDRNRSRQEPHHEERSPAGRPDGKRPPDAPDRRLPSLAWVAIAWLGLIVWLLFSADAGREEISYSAFKDALAEGRIVECEIGPDELHGILLRPDESSGAWTGEDSDEQPLPLDEASEQRSASHIAFRTQRVEDLNLLNQLRHARVEIKGRRTSSWNGGFLLWLPAIAAGILLVFVMLRGLSGAGMGGAAMGFGKSRAKLVAENDIDVSFDDVAGCVEAKEELAEVVEFLQRPERFTSVGARIPKGVLLVGPPGTGKTLLARAVAGEARVPFYSLSGSDFVEMFVGVGAARVRDLFQQAKDRAPCIVFIDELDAVGRARGVRVANVNDERENTLNQLLVEMDGFEANAGVILLSATNRPDVLDPALLRPGRFDRQVVLDAPDADAREAILHVHARNKPLAPDVDLAEVAQATPGFSGADLANTMNEAALLTARRRGTTITRSDLDEAVEKVVAGPERKSHRLGAEEKRRIANHEAGHAVVASFSPHADPVKKISIVPRGRAALGYTLQLPTGDQHLLTRSALFARIRGLLGGRAAEEILLGEVSTGAENDLEQATNWARSAIARFGMGDSVRLLYCASPQAALMPGTEEVFAAPSCSQDMARLIDREAQELLDQLYDEAKQLLVQNKGSLERVAETLMERETLDRDALAALLGEAPGRATTALPPPTRRETESAPSGKI
ncbi:MAG: cell division protein FtsH [Deltaproteobacteria bacterium]|nr:cell division protein FtsH [Deltaproteobacteria bacterium]